MSREGRSVPRGLLAAAAAGAAALAATAVPGSAGGHPAAEAEAANAAPIASLRPAHRRVTVGTKLLLDASRSHDSDGRIVYHLWDLDGDGVFERNTGLSARMRRALKGPGKVRVAVAVIDDDGAYSVHTARIRVTRPADPARGSSRRKSAAKSSPPSHASRARATTEKDERDSVPRPKSSAAPSPKPSPTVQAAASSTTVRIADFKFAPASVEVPVGTTVTWTNEDTAVHTATADDGSFDTGNLAKGVSGEYRFTKAGTFAYHCSPHDFMKATITVTGDGGSTSKADADSGGSGSGGSGDGGGGGGDSGGSNLPDTGLQIASVVLAGLLLLGGGLAVRRRLAGS